MNIDTNRDVIIIGHPRSGSFWFQSCFPHFNAFETFNTEYFDIMLDENKFSPTNFSENRRILSHEETDTVIDHRINLLSQVTVPKCVKILPHQFKYSDLITYNPRIFKWINAQDAQLYWLSRRDRLASFKSALVAITIKEFRGVINYTDITVDLNTIPYLLETLGYHNNNYIKDRLKGPIIEVVYEDLLADALFDKSNASTIQQHSSLVNILNWDDVLQKLPKDFRNEIGY